MESLAAAKSVAIDGKPVESGPTIQCSRPMTPPPARFWCGDRAAGPPGEGQPSSGTRFPLWRWLTPDPLRKPGNATMARTVEDEQARQGSQGRPVLLVLI